MKAHYLKSEIESEDTILYLHGYNSSLGNGESRCQHINSLGFNVIGLDQRGFGIQKGRHEWTILKVVADIEMLLEETPNVLGFTLRNLDLRSFTRRFSNYQTFISSFWLVGKINARNNFRVTCNIISINY